MSAVSPIEAKSATEAQSLGLSRAEGSASILRQPNLALLPNRWRRAPRRWGHPLHSLCSYFAMFPPQLPRVFIGWLTEPGDVVYDPFSGRGTVPLEAVLADRRAYASDANPLAVALSEVKVRIPAASQVRRRIARLERQFRAPAIDDVPDDIRMLYSEPTLRQLAYCKAELERSRPVDAFLVAMLLGLLHGNHSRRGATRGLSISMPNTFAMAPGYVRKYIASHRLERPEVDVFADAATATWTTRSPRRRSTGGKAWVQDTTAPPPEWLCEERVKLVFTSPPYLQVIKYGKYNWVRLWFLGEEPNAVDERSLTQRSLPRYRRFHERDAREPRFGRSRRRLRVSGDRRRATRRDQSINLARDVWEQVAEAAGWRLPRDRDRPASRPAARSVASGKTTQVAQRRPTAS